MLLCLACMASDLLLLAVLGAGCGQPAVVDNVAAHKPRGPIASWLQIASASAGAVRMSSSPTTQSDSTTGQWLFRLYPEGVAHDGVPC